MGHEPEAGLWVDDVRRQPGPEEVEAAAVGGLVVFLAEVPGKFRKVRCEVFGTGSGI